jgi:hypothetical protein
LDDDALCLVTKTMNEFQQKVQQYKEYSHLYHPRPKAPQFNNLPSHHPTQGPFYYTAGDTKIDTAPVGHYFPASLVDGTNGKPRDYPWAPSGHVDPLYYCSDEVTQAQGYEVDLGSNQPPDYYRNMSRCLEAPKNVSINDGTRLLLSQPVYTDILRYAEDLSYERRVVSAAVYNSYPQNTSYPITQALYYPVQQVYLSAYHSWPPDTSNNHAKQPRLLNPRVKALKREHNQSAFCSSAPVTQQDRPFLPSLQDQEDLSVTPIAEYDDTDSFDKEFELLNRAISYFVRYIKRAHMDPNDHGDFSSDSSMGSIYTEESTDPELEAGSFEQTDTKEFADPSPRSTNTLHSMLALFNPPLS